MAACSNRKIGVLSDWLKTVVIFPEVVFRLRPGLPWRLLSWSFTELSPPTAELRRGSFRRRWWLSLDLCSQNRLSIVHVVDGSRFASSTVLLSGFKVQKVCLMLARLSGFCVLLCFGLCSFWVLVPLINIQWKKKKKGAHHYKLNHYTSILKLVAVSRIVYYNIVSMFHNYSWHIIAGEAFRNRLRGHFQVNMWFLTWSNKNIRTFYI